MRRIQVACALLLICHAALSSSFWKQTIVAFKPDGLTYEQRRITHVFNGLPVDEMRARLEQLLPPDTPLSLSEGLRGDAFAYQRLTEALYPNRIEEQSLHQVDMTAPGAAPPHDAQLIATDSAGRNYVLRGPKNSSQPAGGPAHRSAFLQDFRFSFLHLIVLTFSALGFGVSCFSLTGWNVGKASIWPLSCLLAGAVVLAWIASVATWLQIPIHWWNLAMAGIVLLAARATQIFRKTGISAWKPPGAWSAYWETWILAAILFCYSARILAFPVALWDGRSIWIFHSKQLFLNGMFTRTDLLHPESQWSHPEYPLFMPAWLAFFSSFSAGFNERMASAGIAVLMVSLMGLIWRLARQQLGRVAGGSVAFAAFFGIETITSGGYVDGLLMLLLFLQVLAFLSRDHQFIGWIAAGAASLLKFEGLVFSFLVCVACALFCPDFRKQRKLRWFSLLVLAPGIVHYLWTRQQGVRGTYPQLHHVSDWHDLASRSTVILRETWWVLKTGGHLNAQWLLWEGLFAFTLAIGCWIYFRNWGITGRLVTFLIFTQVAFVYAVMVLTPYDLQWHVSSSIDRLLYFPAILAIFGLFSTQPPASRVQ